ncbi:TadE-like protein [Pleomorphomonas sp. SM30]|uniref:Flp pilus assembly protein TadG n=1 Tax=Oharaeibacter diazotrophicus TaxID=1920512 RepID=A0A4R6RD28_9HYPH|nr:TadE/TadG family type IV pilus assembly protein [Oharaeibacter diazotrophicus]TDP84141.1 Flp pilus assembly protein TadG [Oharaeibacter diazotrophicus]BBE73180.1 TadE-like protein [Pleomorphomonas sp. SM30]GLS74969.1 pilus biosynthesis protein TadE [Oharaeibacter diazotrophicus]
MAENTRAPTVDRDRPRRGLFARFGRGRDGAVALEFAIVSIPFFALMFAIIETALMFFVSQILDTAVTKASRQIRTGQAQQAGMDAGAFKTQVCNSMLGLVDCRANLYVDVKTYASFGSYAPTSPVDPTTKQMKPTTYSPGGSGSIVVVRAFYAWPTYFTPLSANATKLADGRRLLGAVVAFRNEPFPW